MSVRSNICTFITAAVLSANPPCYYRFQQHYLTNHTVAKLLYLTCTAQLILKIKNLFIWFLTLKFLTCSLLFCFNIFFNSDERLDKMNEKFVEFLSDHKFILPTLKNAWTRKCTVEESCVKQTTTFK